MRELDEDALTGVVVNHSFLQRVDKRREGRGRAGESGRERAREGERGRARGRRARQMMIEVVGKEESEEMRPLGKKRKLKNEDGKPHQITVRTCGGADPFRNASRLSLSIVRAKHTSSYISLSYK